MFHIALTGGVASGKSTALALLAGRGIPCFCADEVVAELYAPYGKAWRKLRAAFPALVSERGVCREKLWAMLLRNPSALGRLEKLVHPLLKKEMEGFARQNESAPLLCFDIPLLFETHMEKRFDAIILLSTPPHIRRARASMPPAHYGFLLGRQNSFFKNKCALERTGLPALILKNGGKLENLQRQLDGFLASLSP